MSEQYIGYVQSLSQTSTLLCWLRDVLEAVRIQEVKIGQNVFLTKMIRVAYPFVLHYRGAN